MLDTLPAVVDTLAQPIAQASSDRELVGLWIGRHESRHTRRNYARQADLFLAFIGKPIAAARLADLQAFSASLSDKAPATRANAIASVKSLLSFGQEIGMLRFNVGKAVKAPAIKNVLAERIMDESSTIRLIALESAPRNKALLTLLYGAGLRISEAAALRWRDLANRDDAGQATVFGKGGKTRIILLSRNTWVSLQAIRPEHADQDAPVFASRKGGAPLDASQIHRVVKAAAARAGLSEAVSAHWLRHAHASHALDRGAPISLLQATLGHASVATTGRYTHARPNDSTARFLAV